MIRFLAKFFRQLHFIVGITLPGPGMSDRTFVLMWMSIIGFVLAWCVFIIFLVTYVLPGKR